MKIDILQGEHTIGGNIIVIRDNKDTTHIVLDVGSQMGEEDKNKLPEGADEERKKEIRNLFYNPEDKERREKGNTYYDGVFISHSHPDHVGLMDRMWLDIDVYMDDRSYRQLKEWQNQSGIKTRRDWISNYYLPIPPGSRKVWISAEREYEYGISNENNRYSYFLMNGTLKVKPYRCDHTGFPCYMFLITSNSNEDQLTQSPKLGNAGSRIFYTGDFRGHGHDDFEKLLARLPEADTLICEGTTLNSDIGYPCRTESDLSKAIAEKIWQYRMNEKNIFILVPGTNFARFQTIDESLRLINQSKEKDAQFKFSNEWYWNADLLPTYACFHNSKHAKYLKFMKPWGIRPEMEPHPEWNIHLFKMRKKYDSEKLIIEQKELREKYKNREKEEFIKIINSSESADQGYNSIGIIRNTRFFRECFEEAAKSLSEKDKQHNRECPGDKGIILYSLWRGYAEHNQSMQDLLNAAEECGYKIVKDFRPNHRKTYESDDKVSKSDDEKCGFHTGGHADRIALVELIAKVRPKLIKIIHTQSSDEDQAHYKTLENVQDQINQGSSLSQILWDYFLHDNMNWMGKPWVKPESNDYENPKEFEDNYLKKTSLDGTLGAMYFLLKQTLFCKSGIHLIGANLQKWHKSDYYWGLLKKNGVNTRCELESTVIPGYWFAPDIFMSSKGKDAFIDWERNCIVLNSDLLKKEERPIRKTELLCIRELSKFMAHYYVETKRIHREEIVKNWKINYPHKVVSPGQNEIDILNQIGDFSMQLWELFADLPRNDYRPVEDIRELIESEKMVLLQRALKKATYSEMDNDTENEI